MKKQLIVATVVATATLCNGAETVVTNESGIAEIPPIVIEATRLGKTTGEIPTGVRVYSSKQISSSGSRDVTEFLTRTTPSINIMRTGAGNPALAEISSAGYGENGFGRLLVMVDGQRLNNADMSAPLLSQINPGAIDRLEILNGSQNVLHGDGASAGVINIVTEPIGYDFGGNIEARAGSFNTFATRTSLHGGDKNEGVKWWSAAGWERSDGYRENNSWKLWNASAGLKKEWENESFLRISTFWNNSRYGLPGYAANHDWKNHPRRASSPVDWARRQTAGLNITLDAAVSDENHLQINSSFSQSRSRARFYSAWSDYRSLADVTSFEVSPQWMNTARLFEHDNEFILGTSYNLDYLNGINTFDPEYDHTRMMMGFFLQDTFHFNDCLAFETGARWQRSWSENTLLVNPKRISGTFAADAGLLFTPIETLKTYAKFSRFYRSPFLDENPYRYGAPQEILKPETGLAFNIGANWQVDDEISLFADAGISRTDDELFYEPFFAGTNVNASDPVMRETLTTGASWHKDKFASFSLAHTFVNAEFDDGEFDGCRIPMSATSTLVASGRFWLCDEFSLFGGYRFISSRHAISDFANNAPETGSVSVFHAGARYECSSATFKGVYISLVADNLFDRRYADYVVYSPYSDANSYYPAAGRSFMLTIGYDF